MEQSNIYHFTRNDEVGYDEHYEWVIIAPTTEKALEVLAEDGGGAWYEKSNRLNKPIVIGTSSLEPQLICACFNAG